MVKFILCLTNSPGCSSLFFITFFLLFQQLKESMDEGVTDEEYEDEDEYIYDSPPSIAD